jgi:hypothetical protein
MIFFAGSTHSLASSDRSKACENIHYDIFFARATTQPKDGDNVDRFCPIAVKIRDILRRTTQRIPPCENSCHFLNLLLLHKSVS